MGKNPPAFVDEKGDKHYYFPGPPARDGKNVHRHYLGKLENF